ncbi:hypothetical protein ACFXP3_37605, partial [Streptomyces sp. NPDC059096]
GGGARGGGGRGPPPRGGGAAAGGGRPRLTEDDRRAEPRLRPLLAGAGWLMESYTDEDTRFLALAVRAG